MLHKQVYICCSLNHESENTGNIVVIPCYNEPYILESLKSLDNNIPPQKHVKVVVVVNHPENTNNQVKVNNYKAIQQIASWIPLKQNPKIDYEVIEAFNLLSKEAGVGLARKIGMDYALQYYRENNTSGIITCFDADCTCSKNYLSAIEAHFENNKLTPACSINFEHPLSGDRYDANIYNSILNYELHLRYYKHALTYIKYPFDFYTIGSCMAVRSDVYFKTGGMNKRKAGEDFYFLQKIMLMGNFTFLNRATVYPSPRISYRVPFGTGKAVAEMITKQIHDYMTYAFDLFEKIKLFLDKIPEYHQKSHKVIKDELPEPIVEYLKNINFNEHLEKIKSQSHSTVHFINRFYYWFTPFRLLKMVHFLRDNYYANEPVQLAVKKLLQAAKGKEITDKKNQLMYLRALDKKE